MGPTFWGVRLTRAAGRLLRCAGLLWLSGVAATGAVRAATIDVDAVRYVFATAPYDRIVDPVATPTLSYDHGMGLEISIYFNSPLLARLDRAGLSPLAVGFDDGVHLADAVDLSRFTGWVSTDPGGRITDFFVQIYRDAGEGPGVWIRRVGSQVDYKATRSQSVVTGYADRCSGWTACPPEPLTQWVTDRAEGAGPVRLSSGAVARLPSPSSPPAPVPGPASILLLLTALGVLAWRRGV